MSLPPAHIPDLQAILQELVAIANETLRDEALAFAHDETHRFKRNIERQTFASFRHIPLSEKYLARKLAKGADPRTMIATRHYLRSIRVHTRARVDGLTVYIGFHDRVRARDLDGRIVPELLLIDVAAIQEHGSVEASIPARPHWRPHYREMRRRARDVRAAVRTKVLKQLKAAFK